MARNEVYKDADYLSLPVPAGTLSGAAVRVGGLNGVAQTNEGGVDRAARNADRPYVGPASPSSNEDGFASVALKGGWRLPVTTAVAAIGTPIYITGTNTLTTTATDNNLYGHALSTKASGAGTVIVRIHN
jgi:predicted RecA/RadA family phage recombinase